MTLSDTGATTETVVKGAYGEAIAGSTAESYSGIAQAMRIDGLDYMHHRMYDPEDGEFLANDPIVGNRAGASYGYASGDPMLRIDPWGLQDLNWEARKPPGWWTRQWREWSGRLLKDTPLEPQNLEAQAAIEKYRRSNAEAGLAVLAFAEKRGVPILQVTTGMVEIAAGMNTLNPILFLHGWDMLGTGVLGWRDETTYSTGTSSAAMYVTKEWLGGSAATVGFVGMAADMFPSSAPTLLGPALRQGAQEANFLYQFFRPRGSSGTSQLLLAESRAWAVEGSSCGALQRPRFVDGYGYKDAPWSQAVRQLQEGQDLQMRTLRAAAELRRDAFPDFTRSKYRGPIGEAPNLSGTYDWHDPRIVPHPPHHQTPHIQIWDEEGNVMRIMVDPKSSRVEKVVGAEK